MTQDPNSPETVRRPPKPAARPPRRRFRTTFATMDGGFDVVSDQPAQRRHEDEDESNR